MHRTRRVIRIRLSLLALVYVPRSCKNLLVLISSETFPNYAQQYLGSER